jgi:hypothetical protein
VRPNKLLHATRETRARLVTWLGIITLFSSAEAGDSSFAFVKNYGTSDPICGEAKSVLERTDSAEFWDGRWPRSFGMHDWARSSWSIITTSGTREDVPFKYSRGDLDGDGSDEIALVTTGMIRSVNFDWLYLINVHAFRTVQRDEDMRLALDQARKLNPSNVVVFSNDAEAIPVELELWPREGKTYLLLKEHNFAKAGERIANTFLVASLVNAASSGDEQRLHPRLVCRFVLK